MKNHREGTLLACLALVALSLLVYAAAIGPYHPLPYFQ